MIINTPEADAYNPLDFNVRRNPYRVFEKLRSQGDVLWHKKFHSWYVLSNHSAKFLLKHPMMSSNVINKIRLSTFPSKMRDKLQPLYDLLTHWLLFTDQPDHHLLRKSLNPYFSKKSIEEFELMILKTCRQSLQNLNGHFDFRKKIANQVPLKIICHLLGLPMTDLERFENWNETLGRFIDSVVRTPEIALPALQSVSEQKNYFSEFIRQQLSKKSANFVKGIISTDVSKALIKRDELWFTLSMLLGTGAETLSNLLSNGLLLLNSYQDQLQKLKQQPELIPSAIDEILRFDPPVQNVLRVATDTIMVSHRHIQKGDFVQITLAAVNRDPAVFDNSNDFNVARTLNPHLAFGSGIHFCLGRFLAKKVAEVFFEQLLQQDYWLVIDDIAELDWHSGIMLRSLKKLPVHVVTA